MSNPFEELRTFVAVVQHHTISAAARELGLAKSAVSRRLAELEDRLGVRLVHRSSRTLALTDSGAELFDRAQRLMADLQEAESVVSRGAADAVGVLRISVPVSFSAHCLAPVLGRFLEANPRLELDIDSNDRHVDLVREGFDLAIRISVLKDSSLIARRIAPIRRALCASPEYLKRYGVPRSLQDLAHHRTVGYTFAEPRNCWIFKGGQEVLIKPVMTISNGDSIREAVIGGCGIAYLPTFIIYRAVKAGQLRILLPETGNDPISLSVLYPSNRNVATKVRRFIDFCMQEFGDRPYWDDIVLQGSR
jgi:DNA-binding transcriptional LysR family regulator